jgi:mannose-6-phosphate isomerase-like protein (cupin superfamily)
MNSELTVQSREHFSVADLGAFVNLDRYTFKAEGKPELEGKIFLKDLLRLTSAEISVNSLRAGRSIPFYHKHRLNEEIYIFLQGQGEFQVDGIVFQVHEGVMVRVDPEGERCLRNTSTDLDLYWIVVQSRRGSYEGDTIQDGYGVQKRVSWQGKTKL